MTTSISRKTIALIASAAMLLSPVNASALPSSVGSPTIPSSTSVSEPLPQEHQEQIDVPRNINEINTLLESNDATFRFQSLEGNAGDFEIVLSYEDVTFSENSETGMVVAAHPDGTSEVFEDNAVESPVEIDYQTQVSLVSDNSIAISASHNGIMPMADPYNIVGCVQSVLGSASALAAILGTTAVVAQALAAAGAAVAIAAASLYCSTI